LLADSSKRDAHASYRIDGFSEIDYMISDYAKPQNMEYFNQKHWLQI
ncbi:DeoR/GlpR transcriptional regulator, partial [Staphylococcus warneri]